MKLVLPEISEVIKISADLVNTIIIENPGLMHRVVCDLVKQLNKEDGLSVLSINNEPVDIYKNVELITDIYSIDYNCKNIASKMIDSISTRAVDEFHYENTMKLLADINKFIDDIVWDEECEISCGELNIKQIIKACDIKIIDDEEDIAERVYKYIEIVRRFLGKQLIVFVNCRAFIMQDKFDDLIKTCIAHKIKVLFIDNREYPKTELERRLNIDIDLCEF